MIDKYKKLEKLQTEYLEQYPEEKEERAIGALLFSYGVDKTIEILEKRKGRKIKLITDPNKLDWLDYKYV